MDFLDSLLTWANLPFTASLATVLTFAALQASGLLGALSGGEHDTGDGGADADASHEVDHDAGGDHDADHDSDHDADRNGGGAPGSTGLLGTLGVGRLPTSIIWQTFAMSFGMVGVVTNSVLLITTHHLRSGSLVVSFPIAFFGAYGLTAVIARAVAKVVKPPAEASGKRHLVGLSGVVVSGQVDDQYGEIRVKLNQGDFVQVACRVPAGEQPIGHHESVVILSYDRAEDRIFVAPVPAEASPAPPSIVHEHS